MIGHNSEPATAFAKDQLKSIIERIERLEERKEDDRGRHPRRLRGIEGQRLRRQGAAHHREDAEAGSERARRGRDGSRDLHARPWHARMKPAGNPWMKFYPSDWRSDPALRSCPIAARGLWIEMMAIMHEAEPYGSLLVKGKRVDKKQLAALVGVPERECTVLLLELEGFGVFARDTDGTIYSRRMRRDHAKANEGKKEVSKRWGDPDGLSRSQRLSAARAKAKHTAGEWQALLEICDFKCVKCGGDEGGRGVVKDHIVPIYRGGSDGIDNIQPLCQPCNASKGPDETDHRRHGWKERLKKRLGREGAIYEKTPTQKPEARSQNDDAKPRASLISPEAFEITDALEKACGFNLPEETPPGWYGCAMWVQKCLNEGWLGIVMIEAAKAVALRKKGGFIESFKYLEKPLAQAMAEQSAPLPKVEIRQPEQITVNANGKSKGGNIIQAADRLLDKIRSFDSGPIDNHGIRDGAGEAATRLLSQG
jgi:5-methylcytosine-specific restriction endonuclease McrA